MTDTTNNQLQSVIERIERMEVEKAAVAEDIKQIYLEAKGNGFDTKIIRKVIAMRKKSAEEREAERAMIELYLGQLSDTPLGRYQATISRAVEIEWQRNCVRHRDFITPGFLTVRFFVETGGKVRSVQFVGDMETGEVQKGFTLNAIRKAAIPPMPKALRKQYDDDDPLELMFRFYF